MSPEDGYYIKFPTAQTTLPNTYQDAQTSGSTTGGASYQVTQSAEQHVCPNCGYCPSCGRSNPQYPVYPIYPWYPVYPTYPTYPWYPNSNYVRDVFPNPNVVYCNTTSSI